MMQCSSGLLPVECTTGPARLQEHYQTAQHMHVEMQNILWQASFMMPEKS